MRTFKNPSVANRGRALLAAAVLIASAGVAAAKDQYPANAQTYYGLYQSPSDSIAPSRADRADFDRSGTRGREGLGESPFHPEGPGNVAD